MTRYQRGQEFWEISLDGRRLRTREGLLGGDAKEKVQRFRDELVARRAQFAAIDEKKRGGWKLVTTGLLLPQSWQPARHAELEAAIEAAPDDVSLRLVYADWLQSQGDLRGELIVLSEVDAAAADEFIQRHRNILVPRALRSDSPYLDVAWKYGFVDQLSLLSYDLIFPDGVVTILERDDDTLWNDVYAKATALFQHPSLRFLRELRVFFGGGLDAQMEEIAPAALLRALSESPARNTLQTLELHHVLSAENIAPHLDLRTTLEKAQFTALTQLRIARHDLSAPVTDVLRERFPFAEIEPSSTLFGDDMERLTQTPGRAPCA